MASPPLLSPKMPIIPKGAMTIKYKDVFYFEDLYKTMHWWLADRRWEHADQHEKLYLEKVSQDGGTEHLIRWHVEKDPQDSPKGMYKFTMDIEFHSLAIKPKEVVVEGKKIGAVIGEVEIKITPFLLINHDAWNNDSIFAVFKGWFFKRHFKPRIEALKLEYYNEVYEFQGSIKKFLQLKQFLPHQDQEPFHPSRSYPS